MPSGRTNCSIGNRKRSAPGVWLEDEETEIHQFKSCARGRIENESIDTQTKRMSLLEVLRSRLYPGLVKDFQHALAFFLDPAIYSRSVLEDRSFTWGSVSQNSGLHRSVFNPRLSGVTRELLNIRMLMVVAERFRPEKIPTVTSVKWLHGE